ncbi:MAG: hypothetical protein K0S07_1033 [Chlamydiales bacterium]|jgi:hypothetical protein|nr:hypothetical protein [Chlamydiales bacterium]
MDFISNQESSRLSFLSDPRNIPPKKLRPLDALDALEQKTGQAAQLLSAPCKKPKSPQPIKSASRLNSQFLAARNRVHLFLKKWFSKQGLTEGIAHFFPFSLEEFGQLAYYIAYESSADRSEEETPTESTLESIHHLYEYCQLPLGEKEVRHQIYSLIEGVQKRALKRALSLADQQRVGILQEVKAFLDAAHELLDIGFSSHIPLKRGDEKQATLPYFFLKECNGKRNENLQNLEDLFADLRNMLHAQGASSIKNLVTLKRMAELIDHYDFDHKRYLERHRHVYNCLYSEKRPFLQKPALEKKTAISLMQLLLVDPIENHWLECAKFYNSLQKIYQEDPLGKNLAKAFYKDFLRRLLHQEFTFKQEELSQLETLEPFFTILKIMVHRVQLQKDNRQRKRKTSPLKKTLSPAWKSLLEHLSSHIKEIQDSRLLGEDPGAFTMRAVDILSYPLKNRVELLSGLNIQESSKNTFQQILRQPLFKLLARVESILQANYEGVSEEIANEKRDMMYVQYQLASIQNKVFRSLTDGFERAISLELAEEKKQKAQDFYRQENADLIERSQRFRKKKRQAPQIPVEKIDATYVEEEEIVDAPKFKEIQTPSLKRREPRDLNYLLHHAFSLKPAPCSSLEASFQSDAGYHLTLFTRGWELLQLAKDDQPLGVLPLLIYHLGLANEQALSPFYIKQYPEKELTHHIAHMARDCGLDASLIEPLNQSSIAFRYPHEHQRHLLSLQRQAPVGLTMILTEPEGLSQPIEQVFKEGMRFFASCFLRRQSLSPFQALLTQVKEDFRKVMPSLSLEPSINEAREAFLKASFSPLYHKLSSLVQNIHPLIASQEEAIQPILKDALTHLQGLEPLLKLAEKYPHQRFLSFFTAALTLRGQYALENMAQAVSLLNGVHWRTHSLKAYSDAYQLKSRLSKPSQETWDLYDMGKATDYPFWHLSSKPREWPLLNKLHRHYQLAQRAVEAGEGYVWQGMAEDSPEKAYHDLAELFEKTVHLLEEVVKKILSPKLGTLNQDVS